MLKRVLIVNKEYFSALFTIKALFSKQGWIGREGYGFFAFFCWPALSTDLYDRAESTDASDKTDNTLM